jgi:hypothetical protein
MKQKLDRTKGILDKIVEKANHDLIEESVRILKLDRVQARKFRRDFRDLIAKGVYVQFEEDVPGKPWAVVYGLGLLGRFATKAEAEDCAEHCKHMI